MLPRRLLLATLLMLITAYVLGSLLLPGLCVATCEGGETWVTLYAFLIWLVLMAAWLIAGLILRRPCPRAVPERSRSRPTCMDATDSQVSETHKRTFERDFGHVRVVPGARCSLDPRSSRYQPYPGMTLTACWPGAPIKADLESAVRRRVG